MEEQELSSNGISRLQEEHIKLYHEARGRLRKWEEFLQDYTALENRLQSLPEQTTHNVMVPLGRKAFMHGQLIHTNEVMVLLGDNWFVQRSAKQSVDIIHRRKDHLARMLDDTRKEMSNIEAHLGIAGDLKKATDEHKDCVEIQEEVPARSAALPSSLHASGKRIARVPKVVDGKKAMPPRPAFSQSSSGSSASEQTAKSKGKKSFEELMAHLEKLELEEGGGSSEDEGSDVTEQTATIHFKHSKAPTTVGESSDQPKAFMSPADIYAHYLQRQEEGTSTAKIDLRVDDDDDDDVASALNDYYGDCASSTDPFGQVNKHATEGVQAHPVGKPQKSLLKRPGERSSSGSRVRFNKEVDERQLEVDVEERPLASSSSQTGGHSRSLPAGDVTAFTGHVVERFQPKEVPVEASQTSGQKPVSRFKASRRKT